MTESAMGFHRKIVYERASWPAITGKQARLIYMGRLWVAAGDLPCEFFLGARIRRPPPELLIVLGSSREDLEDKFESCQLIAHITNREGVPNEETARILISFCVDICAAIGARCGQKRGGSGKNLFRVAVAAATWRPCPRDSESSAGMFSRRDRRDKLKDGLALLKRYLYYL